MASPIALRISLKDYQLPQRCVRIFMHVLTKRSHAATGCEVEPSRYSGMSKRTITTLFYGRSINQTYYHLRSNDYLLRNKFYPNQRINGRAEDQVRKQYMQDLCSFVRTHVSQFEQNGIHSNEEIWAYLKGLVQMIRAGKGELNADIEGKDIY